MQIKLSKLFQFLKNQVFLKYLLTAYFITVTFFREGGILEDFSNFKSNERWGFIFKPPFYRSSTACNVAKKVSFTRTWIARVQLSPSSPLKRLWELYLLNKQLKYLRVISNQYVLANIMNLDFSYLAKHYLYIILIFYSLKTSKNATTEDAVLYMIKL